MSFLTHHGDDVPFFDPPNRVYARVDRWDPPDEESPAPQIEATGEPLLLFDSVDADWFDEVQGRVEWLGDAGVVNEADGGTNQIPMPIPGAVVSSATSPASSDETSI